MAEDEISENEDQASPPMVTAVPVAPADLIRAADHALTEDVALSLLKRPDCRAKSSNYSPRTPTYARAAK